MTFRSGFGLFMVVGLRGKGLRWLFVVDVGVVVLLDFLLSGLGARRAQPGRLVEPVGVDRPVAPVADVTAPGAAVPPGDRVALQARLAGRLVAQVAGAHAVAAEPEVTRLTR